VPRSANEFNELVLIVLRIPGIAGQLGIVGINRTVKVLYEK
jgi:hypothetical protein